MSNLKSMYIDQTTRDLVLDDLHRIAMVDGHEARKQRLWLRLGTHLGEWFLDTFLGVPWLEIMEKGTSKALMAAEIRKAILSDEEVVSIESLEISPLENRAVHIRFTATLSSGETMPAEVTV